MANNALSIILASGGSGLRFGSTKVSKQYLKIKNIPVFLYEKSAKANSSLRFNRR